MDPLSDVPSQIEGPARNSEPDSDIGMGQLEGAQSRHQPIGGEGMDRGDREHALGRPAYDGKSGLQAVEGFAHLGRQALAHLRQRDLSRLAQEQGRAHPILQELHLVADGGLGHAQLGGRLGEAFMARGSLEGADGGERRQLG